MKKQQGVSLTGLLMVLIVLALGGLVGAKLAPAYIDYFGIQKIFAAMEQSGDLTSMSAKDLRISFNKRGSIDNIRSISGDDIQITKRPDGKAIMSAEYSVKVPIAANVSVVIDFSVSTEKPE